MWLWCARVEWALLPVTAGGAFNDLVDGWSTPTRAVAVTLAWAAWLVGLFALAAPRPWGLTALRVLAPGMVAVAIATAWSTSAASSTLAIASALITAVLVLTEPIATACVNAFAYGDELRNVVRIPVALLLGPVPLAIALILAGLTAGPLLIAAEQWIAGIVLTVGGIVVAAALTRSLHTLSKRWFVFVPAGVVFVDPISLADPVLVLRENVACVEQAAILQLPADALDLRAGTAVGSIAVSLSPSTPFARRAGRTNTTIVEPSAVFVSVLRPARVVATAGDRRLPAR